MENWINAKSENNDIVLSSRIRLARNIKGYQFPNKLSKEDANKLTKNIEDAFYNSEKIEDNFKTISVDSLNAEELASYFEKHLISRKLIENKGISSFILDKDETISIMINEEDHLRIQYIVGGLKLKEIYEKIDQLDNILEEKLEYSYDCNLGYLTSCPTNLGTGLRASVMLHLPALCLTNEIDNIFDVVTKVGMTIRGLYGEGSKGYGNIFQISNQITLGLNENDIINGLNAIIFQIIEKEKNARERIKEQYKYNIEDKIMRALGLLNFAVLLSDRECKELLSAVRLGVEMNLLDNISKNVLNEIMVETGVINIKLQEDKNNDKKFIEYNIANMVKEKLSNI